MQYYLVIEHVVNKTHTQYVIFIAFQLQHWQHESASMLRYTYLGWLVPFLKGLTMRPQSQTVANETDNFKADRTSFEVTKRVIIFTKIKHTMKNSWHNNEIKMSWFLKLRASFRCCLCSTLLHAIIREQQTFSRFQDHDEEKKFKNFASNEPGHITWLL